MPLLRSLRFIGFIISILFRPVGAGRYTVIQAGSYGAAIQSRYYCY